MYACAWAVTDGVAALLSVRVDDLPKPSEVPEVAEFQPAANNNSTRNGGVNVSGGSGIPSGSPSPSDAQALAAPKTDVAAVPVERQASEQGNAPQDANTNAHARPIPPPDLPLTRSVFVGSLMLSPTVVRGACVLLVPERCGWSHAPRTSHDP